MLPDGLELVSAPLLLKFDAWSTMLLVDANVSAVSTPTVIALPVAFTVPLVPALRFMTVAAELSVSKTKLPIGLAGIRLMSPLPVVARIPLEPPAAFTAKVLPGELTLMALPLVLFITVALPRSTVVAVIFTLPPLPGFKLMVVAVPAPVSPWKLRVFEPDGATLMLPLPVATRVAEPPAAASTTSGIDSDRELTLMELPLLRFVNVTPPRSMTDLASRLSEPVEPGLKLMEEPNDS